MDQKVKKQAVILVVDDQTGVRRLLFEALKDIYEEVITASSGMEALEEVKICMPDLVLMDMKMPRMNGLETIRALREIAFTNPVILMTAYGDLEVIAQAEKLGVHEHITKPFDILELRKLIQDTLDFYKKGEV